MDSLPYLASYDIPMEIIFKYYVDSYFSNDDSEGSSKNIRNTFSSSALVRLVCKRFDELYRREIQRRFKNIVVSNPIPYDDTKWRNLDCIKYPIKSSTVDINGLSCVYDDIIPLLRYFSEKLRINLASANVFPIHRDMVGDPPQNCKYLGLAIQILKFQIMELLADPLCINHVVSTITKLPKVDKISKLTLSSSFLEFSANKLPENVVNSMQSFLNSKENIFGNTQCEELTMILTDCICIFDSEMVFGSMDIPAFYPLELLRMTILSLRPTVLILKIRSECASSVSDGYRCEWDDYNLFTNCVLYNSPDFNTTVNYSLGSEQELVEMALIVDTYSAKSWKANLNKNSFQNVGKDLLSLFPMRNIVIGYHERLNVDHKMNYQIRDTFNALLDSFWKDDTICQGRNIYFKIFFENDANSLERITNRILRKSIPRSFNNVKLRIEYDVKEAVERFNCNSSQCLNERYKNVLGLDTLVVRRHFVSIFDSLNRRVLHFDVNDVAHF